LSLTADDVIAATCALFKVERKAMYGASRNPQVVAARQIAMYVARTTTGASYPELGEAFNRHHTTVMDQVAKGRRRVAEAGELWQRFEALVTTLEHQISPPMHSASTTYPHGSVTSVPQGWQRRMSS
jgi:chromosomal replication initiator protein